MENLDKKEIEQMINKIRKWEKLMLQKEQTDKIELENYKLEPKAKEKREEMLIKIHQIKYMKIEGREKLKS